jgi:hypothetical protein
MRRTLQVLFILAVGGLAFLYARLDRLVKGAVEGYGSDILKARVSVRSVHLSPFSGEGTLKGLEIGSPAGFSEPFVLRVARVHVRVEPRSLTTDRVVVREVDIEAPELRYERNASGSNLDALQRSAAAYAPAEPRKKSGKPKTVVIDRFTARGGKAAIDIFGAKASAALPDISATGIGEGSGATPQQAAQRILGALSDSALKAVAASPAAARGIGGAISRALSGLFGR